MSRLPSRAVALALLLVARAASATPCPNVMFVLDRSGSMAQDPMGGSTHPSKWELLQAAVKNIVTMYGDQLPIGLEMFTTNGSDDATCYMDTLISVEPGPGTRAQIISIVSNASPDSLTNTAQAIRRAASDPVMHDPARAQYIILITDGDPNCPSDDSTNAKYTIAELTRAAQQNPSIHTFVVGFDGSGGVNPANLNGMARAGLEPQKGCTGSATSPCYFSASNAARFNSALAGILTTISMGEFGGGMCDDSCFSTGCGPGQVCRTDEVNRVPHCVADPCAGVTTCQAGDFCREGSCVHACLVECASAQRCVDGNCVPDPCTQVRCADGQFCDPTSGACVANQCLGRSTCPSGTDCDPVTGTCIQDECRIIKCPDGTTCRSPRGDCESGVSHGADGGTATGRGRAAVGCAVAYGGLGRDGAGALVALLGCCVALGLGARRRRRSR